MLKKILKKIFRAIGFDIIKFRPGPQPLDFLKQYNIQTIIDIGANIGFFSLELRQVLPQASIYAFEPLKSCFETLNKNLTTDTNFKSFNIALGEKEETLTMNKSDYAPSSSLKKMTDTHKEAFPHSIGHEIETVLVKRLDDVMADKKLTADILVKIDVQGFEDKVILGGDQTLKKAKVVLMESCFQELYEGQKLFGELYKMMTDLGFSYAGSLSSKRHHLTGDIIFEDSVYIRQ